MDKDLNKGSIWRIWDLQVQTIIDDRYISLNNYYETLKTNNASLWKSYTDKIGGEANALLFDSHNYFNDDSINQEERCSNYSRNLFAFIETYAPNLGLIGVTDHNYSHSRLIDHLYKYSEKAKCKCLCGVEINASGIHMLIYFETPPYGKKTFSEGIKSFLDSIKIHQPERNSALTVSSESPIKVIDEVIVQSGIVIFPHCNSDNGLFQERGKTDRIHLSDIFNYQKVIFLQSGTSESAKKTSDYINSRADLFKVPHLFSISPDSRSLQDIGKADEKGFSTWVKADTTFKGLKEVLIENDRIEVTDEPKLLKRVKANKTKFLKSLKVNKTVDATLDDIWFDDFQIELNSGLIAIIGNKGSGKSAIADIMGLCGNTYQEPSNFSFLTSQKFRKARPFNLADRFEASITWEDNTVNKIKLSENPNKNLPERVKYIPQNFLESVCANVESDQFERELKQIIYYHTPVENRLGKSSLDELIDHQSSLVNDEISRLKFELSKLNSEIVFTEHKATENYKTSIENQVQLKENELAAHAGIKPLEPRAFHAGINTEEVNKLNELRQQQQTLETEIKNDKARKASLILESEELLKTSQHFIALNEQLLKEVSEDNLYIKTLKSSGIKIEDVIRFRIDVQPITNKIEEKQIVINSISISLDENVQGSKTHLLTQLIKKISEGQELLDKPAKEHQKYLSDLKQWTDKRAEIEGDKDTEGTLHYYKNQLDYLGINLPIQLQDLYNKRESIVSLLYDKKQELKEIRKKLFEPVSKFIEDFKELKERYDVKFDAALEVKSLPENFFSFINQARIGTFSGKEEGYKKLNEIMETCSFESKENFILFSKKLLENLKNDMRYTPNNKIDILTQLKTGKQLNDLYDYIFSYDYLQPVYNLKLGEKTLQELSPGERGALLLIFYLILDNDDIPLVIDQPEENLDNESVYHILVHFIKRVKEKRQIIIVTHNPNLAVVCDADQIIHMQINKKDKNRVTYFSGGIEELNINKSVVNILEGTLPAFNNRDSKYIR